MKLMVIPPYQNPKVKWLWVLREHVAEMKERGQLAGVEVDIDEGYFIDSTTEWRDEEIFAHCALGLIKKVREYSEKGVYDAIVLTGGVDVGFPPARLVSKIPVVGVAHSSLHVASLIGERCCIIQSTSPGALVARHAAERYGLSHKLISVRSCGHSTAHMYALINRFPDNKRERFKLPEVNKVVDDITAQGIAAIEKERVDCLILVNEAMQTFKDEVKQRIDKAGYGEITIIGGFAAAVEMAKSMVNLKLVQLRRAYPNDAMLAKPEFY